MKTINITLKIDPTEILSFEDVLRNRYEVVDLRVLPNTDDLQDDALYKKLKKSRKLAQKLEYEYIDKMN